MNIPGRFAFLLTQFLVVPLMAEAQSLACETDFSGLQSNSPAILINPQTDYPGWEFTTCYKVKEGGLFVGEEGSPGNFVTAPLGLDGNASIVFEVKRSSSGSVDAQIEASIAGGGILLSDNSMTISSTSYYHIAYYVKDATPSTQITITGKAGKFYVKSMRAYNIGEAIFYESFDGMKYNDDDEFDYFYNKDGKATNASCDNSTGSELLNSYQASGNVFVANKTTNASSYVMPAIFGEELPCALLSFRGARNETTQNGEIILSCTDNTKVFVSGGLKNSMTELLNGENHVWHDYDIILTRLSSSTRLKFAGLGYNIDDVKVTPIPLILDQSKDNSTCINAYSFLEQPQNVLLKRTLTAGKWCPLCVPFEVTQEKMETAAYTSCEIRTLTDLENGIFVFDVATTVSAGVPFLVKPTTEVVNPTFRDVIMMNVPAATVETSDEDYKFVGAYSPVELTTNGSNLFLGLDGNLCKPDEGEGHNHIGGLRAFFVVPQDASSARISFPTTDQVDGMHTPIKSHSVLLPTHNLKGQRVQGKLMRGLYISGEKKYLIP